MNFDVVSNSPEQTLELGRKIGSQLKGGEIIAVCGALGSGKTHLIKGIAEGAGAKDSKEVTSPTFVVVNEYAGRLDIYHIDVYRLNSIAEFETLGFDDFCYPQSVVLIEWADKIESALQGIDYIQIELNHTCPERSRGCRGSRGSGKTKRKIHIENTPEYIIASR
jgi:tRNA threonylcarbamoyladenosine biosynthesis protein TsaE